jgi:hypothetical protein
MKSNICIRANTVGFSHREVDTVLALAGGSVGLARVAGDRHDKPHYMTLFHQI